MAQCIFCLGGTLEIPAAAATKHEQTFCSLLILLQDVCPDHHRLTLHSMRAILGMERGADDALAIDDEPDEFFSHPGHPDNFGSSTC